MSKVKGLAEYVFDYIKMLSKYGASNLYRKHIVNHFLEIYGATSPSVRASVDKVLRYLRWSGFIVRKKTDTLRGYYEFLKNIPECFAWEDLYGENRKRKDS